jgi:dihydrofolate reductase
MQNPSFLDWNIFKQPLGALIFFIAATAEANRTPFDLTEADSEIVAGYATEYSGMRFGFFFFAEYVNVFIVSALLVTLFFGGWQAPFPDPAVGEFVTELNSHASAFLFGRRTFDIFRGYWPDQTDPANPIATAINSLPKYVVSTSLSEADVKWRGEHPDTARLVTGDVVAAVQALKDGPGDELQIWGSGKLLQTLLQHEIVDRFRLMTFPLVLGSGRRLFNDGVLPATMRPVDLTVTDVGIVIGTYEPAGPVRYGQM